MIITYSKFKIGFDQVAIALFNAQWPASPLDPKRQYWFEFDADRNLIDTDVPEHTDGPAAAALASDAEAYAFDSIQPEWHP
jgi:hypothetical protein